MLLSDEDVVEYQTLVKKRHGIEISKAEALEDALSLINFVRLCYKKPDQTQNTAKP